MLRRTAVLVMAMLGITGCSGNGGIFRVRSGTATPTATSPAAAVAVLQAAYAKRDTVLYRTLFTSDFRFVFASGDVSGEPYADSGWTRTDELISAAHMMVTGSTEEPAVTSLSFDFTSALTPVALDEDPATHATLEADYVLRAGLPDGLFYVSGHARFAVVRGDSANVADGAAADSTRWFIRRWEDESAIPTGTMSRGRGVHESAAKLTLGQLKVLYREL